MCCAFRVPCAVFDLLSAAVRSPSLRQRRVLVIRPPENLMRQRSSLCQVLFATSARSTPCGARRSLQLTLRLISAWCRPPCSVASAHPPVSICDDARQFNATFSRAFRAWQIFEFIHVFKISFHLCGLGESIMLDRKPSVVGVARDCVGEQEALRLCLTALLSWERDTSQQRYTRSTTILSCLLRRGRSRSFFPEPRGRALLSPPGPLRTRL